MSWHSVADVEALRNDEALGLSVLGHEIALCLVDGEHYAIGNVCTHQHAFLSDGFVENGYIECPLHQGRFDIRTGKAMGAPVATPIQTYQVKVEDGKVLVYID